MFGGPSCHFVPVVSLLPEGVSIPVLWHRVSTLGVRIDYTLYAALYSDSSSRPFPLKPSKADTGSASEASAN